MSTSTIRSGNVHFEFEGRRCLLDPGRASPQRCGQPSTPPFGRPPVMPHPAGTSAEWASASTAWSPSTAAQCRACLMPAADGMVVSVSTETKPTGHGPGGAS
ncbi:MAG: hypothetical protein Ct9H300mP1_03460 [Planctomycetaceae bacterium]|nr:MAG: hypothetical protein Ct9H300mP1_03460 [Planctomycetaceae bacterium]